MPKLNPNNNKFIAEIIYILVAAILAFLTYFLLGIILSTPEPGTIIMSPSMKPLLSRGDIVFLSGVKENIRVAEVELPFSIGNKPLVEYAEIDYKNRKIFFKDVNKTIFWDKNNSIIVYTSLLEGRQIIHRAIAKIKAKDGIFYLTKGDNNPFIDQHCGKIFYQQLENKELISKPKNWYPVIDISKKERMFCLCALQPNEQNFSSSCLLCTENPCISAYAIPDAYVKSHVIFIFPIPRVGCIKIWPFDNIPSLILHGKLPMYYDLFC